MEYEFYEVRKSDLGADEFLIECGRANNKEEAMQAFLNTLKTENDLDTYAMLGEQTGNLEVSYVLKDYNTKEVLMTVELYGQDLVNAKTGEVL